MIVAARATNQASDKQQAVAMLEETISNTGVVPREVSADAGDYSAKAVDGLQGLGVDPYVAPEQTRRGRVPPPAPGDAYPVVCPPGTGCGASCRPSEAASVTPCAWRPSSRSSARSRRAVASGSSCCEAWRRSGRNGLSSAPEQPAQTVPLGSSSRLCWRASGYCSPSAWRRQIPGLPTASAIATPAPTTANS